MNVTEGWQSDAQHGQVLPSSWNADMVCVKMLCRLSTWRLLALVAERPRWDVSDCGSPRQRKGGRGSAKLALRVTRSHLFLLCRPEREPGDMARGRNGERWSWRT